MSDGHTEEVFLDNLYSTYTVDHSSQTQIMRRLIVKTFKPFLGAGNALELGCSDGYMTEMLSKHVTELDVVDGSERFLSEAKSRALGKKLENVNFTFSLFEKFESKRQYDYIIASYILEHVIDPVQVLKIAFRVLKPDGVLLVVVPNATALSRQLAMHMGLYRSLKGLTENDENHGHRRVYDRADLNRDIQQAGFETIAQGGIMLKILADFQMDKLIDEKVLCDEHVEGLYSLGLLYPELCGSLFSICRKLP